MRFKDGAISKNQIKALPEIQGKTGLQLFPC